MAIKVIAQLPDVKLGKNPGKKFVMRPDLYVPITEKKVFQEAATHSGISAGVIKAAWDAAGEVIRTWATEGHSISHSPVLARCASACARRRWRSWRM